MNLRKTESRLPNPINTPLSMMNTYFLPNE